MTLDPTVYHMPTCLDLSIHLEGQQLLCRRGRSTTTTTTSTTPTVAPPSDSQTGMLVSSVQDTTSAPTAPHPTLTPNLPPPAVQSPASTHHGHQRRGRASPAG